MKRAIKFHGVQALMVLVTMVVGVIVAGYIFGNQNLVPPKWVPFVGQDNARLNARFETAPGVTPGQGQAVTISGIRVGDVAGVELDRGTALLRMRIKRQYAGRIHPDAKLLLRPKTGLKDMVVEIDPGTRASGPALKDGATLGTNATQPDVNLDEILAMLDVDTRQALAMVAGEGGIALGGQGGRAFARDLRRLEPLTRHTAEATRYVVRRRFQLRRLVTNLSRIADELGSRDQQLARFIRSNADLFRRLANQNRNLGASLERLPGAMDASDVALRKVDRLSRTLKTAVPRLRPGARALPAALRDLRPFLRRTTSVLRDQLRPFSRDAQPTVVALAPAAKTLAQTAPDLRKSLSVLNALTNGLAYDPPGDGPDGQSYLFHLAWANHNTNSVLSTQDGVGATRRALLYLPCNALNLLTKIVPPRNPPVGTLVRLLNVPAKEQCAP